MLQERSLSSTINSLCYFHPNSNPCKVTHSPLFHLLLFFFLNIYLGPFCQVLVSAHGTFSGGMWDLAPWPGIELRPPALEAQSYPLKHQRSTPPSF